LYCTLAPVFRRARVEGANERLDSLWQSTPTAEMDVIRSSYPFLQSSQAQTKRRRIQRASRGKKFLQFHENYRPAWYGRYPQSSRVIRPRQPLAQDAKQLDYDIDSDEEWGEEPNDGEELDSDMSDDDDEDDTDDKAAAKKKRKDGLIEDEGFLVPEDEDEAMSDMPPSEKKVGFGLVWLCLVGLFCFCFSLVWFGLVCLGSFSRFFSSIPFLCPHIPAARWL